MISGADIMVKCLENEGISVIFGYPVQLSALSSIPYMILK